MAENSATAEGLWPGVVHDTFRPARGVERHEWCNLELGEVFDSFTVTVNGQPVTIDQISAQGDVGSYLMAGPNTITVRVATTLNNRLADLDSDVANRGRRSTAAM